MKAASGASDSPCSAPCSVDAGRRPFPSPLPPCGARDGAAPAPETLPPHPPGRLRRGAPTVVMTRKAVSRKRRAAAPHAGPGGEQVREALARPAPLCLALGAGVTDSLAPPCPGQRAGGSGAFHGSRGGGGLAVDLEPIQEQPERVCTEVDPWSEAGLPGKPAQGARAPRTSRSMFRVFGAPRGLYHARPGPVHKIEGLGLGAAGSQVCLSSGILVALAGCGDFLPGLQCA